MNKTSDGSSDVIIDYLSTEIKDTQEYNSRNLRS